MIPGETIFSGAPATCPKCGEPLTIDVQYSNAYYLGTWCCGPYSRESGYFATEAEARIALKRLREGDMGCLR